MKPLVERLRVQNGKWEMLELMREAATRIEQLEVMLDDIIDGVNWSDGPFDEKAYRARDAYRDTK